MLSYTNFVGEEEGGVGEEDNSDNDDDDDEDDEDEDEDEEAKGIINKQNSWRSPFSRCRRFWFSVAPSSKTKNGSPADGGVTDCWTPLFSSVKKPRATGLFCFLDVDIQ